MFRKGLLTLGVFTTLQIASAAPFFSVASDPGALSRAAAVNSVAASNSFITLVGAGNLVTFEGLNTGYPAGGFLNLTVDVPNNILLGIQFTGVDATVSGINQNDQTPEYGFNISTGLGANRHLRYGQNFNGNGSSAPGEVTFTFNTPTNYFSTFLTGTQEGLPGDIQIFFNDGTSQIVPFATVNNNLSKNPGMAGGVQFFALRTETNITSLRFVTTGATAFARDLIGLDDVRFGFSDNAVPEPSSLVMVGAGAVLVLLRRRKRSS